MRKRVSDVRTIVTLRSADKIWISVTYLCCMGVGGGGWEC